MYLFVVISWLLIGYWGAEGKDNNRKTQRLA